MSNQSGALPAPETILRTTLPNGLTVLVRENHTSPVAVLQGSLRAGAVQEAPAQAGLAAFVASMLTRGSAHYDYAAFNAAVENVGASLSVAADTHSTDFGVTALAEDFDDLLDLLSDILRRPTFPAEHIERLRQIKLVSIQEREQETGSVAARRFSEALFGRQHPYGAAIDGYQETVSALPRQALQDFHARYFTPQGGVLAIAGDVDAARVLDTIQAHFGDWRGAAVDQPAVVHVRRPGARQHTDDARQGAKRHRDRRLRRVRRADPDFYSVRVANCILGQFGMMGRLGERVREEQGLAYYSYSAAVAEQEDGVWFAAAGVNPDDVEAAIASILTEFDRLGSEAVGAEELADSQAYLTGVVPLMLETNEGVASTLLNMEWYGLGLDYLQRYPALINSVTAADVQRVAARYLRPDACIIATAGPEFTGDEQDVAHRG
jgi:zinc protease